MLKRSQLFIGTLAASSLMTFSSVFAATYYWDQNGDATTTTGGTGTWNTTSTWRSGSSTGTLGDWADGNVAVFGGTAGTVTLSAPVSATGLTFSVGNYVITGSTITLTGTPAIGITSGAATITSAISGSNGLEKTGGGVVLLNGTNDYTGGTVISGGRLNFNSDAALGAANGSITLNGGTLGQQTTTGTGRQGAVQTINTARDIIVGAAGGGIFVAKNGSFTTTGALSGSGAFTTANPGGSGGIPIYRFSSASNTFTGSMTLNTADVRVSSLGDTAGNNIVFTTADSTFRLNDTGATAGLTIDNRAFELSNVNATIDNLNTTRAFTINSDLLATGSGAKTLTLNAAAGPTNIFAGSITNGAGGGTVGITKSGAGIWELRGENTYTGNTTVSQGTLTFADSSESLFLIGASNVNNSVLGTGTVNFDGEFVFDLTSASITADDFWNIVDVGTLNETYGSTFSVNSTVGAFSETSSGIWSITENGTKYEFSQSTGVLTVIPEPTTLGLLAMGAVGLFRRRR